MSERSEEGPNGLGFFKISIEEIKNSYRENSQQAEEKESFPL